MPRFSSTQLAVAAAAGSPLPSAQFDTDRAWHEYQQQWLFSFQPESCLPSPTNPERRNVWKAARRQYQKMAKQLQAASPSFANNATVATATAATATADTAIITTATAATATHLYTVRLPQITGENALQYPPPILSEYAEDARGPGSVPAIWYKQMASVMRATSTRQSLLRQWFWEADGDYWSSPSCWQKALNEWRHLVADADKILYEEALRHRPKPDEQLVPPVVGWLDQMPPTMGDLPYITKANAAQYPPPSLKRFHEGDCGPASAPAVWYKQMTFGGIEWHGADLDDLGCPNRAQISDLYEQQRRRWRRMLPVAQEKERDREKKRKRGRGDKNPRRHEGARPLFG